ncbi:MAG: ferrous iron transport protein B [Megasphaera sp.]|jgi:ferrous iron transport protein B|uniref:ferrous iron transport protein B n=1 Tax=Megasphaera sueciensis TaxID=349094 RepID=UPI003D094252|nr:ferrous iron transport protein B [Megasphaera sp.]MCI1824016.1 ferrous iron transport protein B [Megasphaera sp.]
MSEAGIIKIALAGNPNCGKTTIFNNITGAKQHVGNYPGVTVEKKEGTCVFDNRKMLFVDLPGTYSLTARSLDEVVARNVIINEKPDLIVNVCDASNLERNLYLTAQLIELGRPVVLVLNMMDIADRMGIKIDIQKLRERLGVAVVPVIGSKNLGTKEVLHAIIKAASVNTFHNPEVDYSNELEPSIHVLTDAITKQGIIRYPIRWLAIKLLENDSEVIDSVTALQNTEHILALAATLRDSLKEKMDLEFVFAQYRHQFAVAVYNDAVLNTGTSDSLSDKIDYILTNRVLGLPIFMFIMWLMFNIVMEVGAIPQDWLSSGFDALGKWIGPMIASEQLRSLVVDGVIGGVGAVLSFVPLIILLYLFISLLEDTGYMARAAFLIDRIMRACGLHGKSFIPMILGFGCNVPGIMAARTLDNPKDRMVTILALPFMSCGARLPVYTLLIAAFFTAGQSGTVLFAMYILGIIVAVVLATVLRSTVFKGEQEPFVMEMPPYHIPTVKGVLIHMWERTVLYLKKAGTIILGASILVWCLTAYPMDVEYSRDYDAAKEKIAASVDIQQVPILKDMGLDSMEQDPTLATMYEAMTTAADKAKDDKEKIEQGAYPEAFAALQKSDPAVYNRAIPLYDIQQKADADTDDLETAQKSEKLQQSYAASIGHFVEPVLRPLGFDWKIGVGLVACTAAKEVMISTLGTIYSVGADADDDDNLITFLSEDPDFNPAVALSLMVFSLLYMPCLATLAVMKRETNSWKWPAMSAGLGIILAWVFAFAVYHIALLAGLGA